MLRPAADPIANGGGSALPDINPFGPAALGAGAGLLQTILLIAGGALLIVLMCADSAGVGPRHYFARRRAR